MRNARVLDRNDRQTDRQTDRPAVAARCRTVGRCRDVAAAAADTGHLRSFVSTRCCPTLSHCLSTPCCPTLSHCLSTRCCPTLSRCLSTPCCPTLSCWSSPIIRIDSVLPRVESLSINSVLPHVESLVVAGHSYRYSHATRHGTTAPVRRLDLARRPLRRRRLVVCARTLTRSHTLAPTGKYG